MSRLQFAVEQIVFARNYTTGLLDQTPAEEWYRQPPGGVSHVAWQVGHIAFAEFSVKQTNGERIGFQRQLGIVAMALVANEPVEVVLVPEGAAAP